MESYMCKNEQKLEPYGSIYTALIFSPCNIYFCVYQGCRIASSVGMHGKSLLILQMMTGAGAGVGTGTGTGGTG